MADELPDIEGAGGLKREAMPVLVIGGDGEPVDQGAMAAAIGTPADAPWDGEAGEATMISVLKMIALNTVPLGG